MQFLAEIKRTSQRKAGLDNIYQLVLETEDNQILDLGKLPADCLVQVDITLEGEEADG